MEDEQIPFLPFHAINEFMRPGYRLEVVRSTLQAMPALDETFRLPIERVTRQVVKVPGFRNSAKAPVQVRARPTAEAFEKSPDLVAALLSAWSEAHPNLRQLVYDLLTGRSWEILPAEADRTQLPGFLTTWPKGEDFDALNQAFSEAYPDQTFSPDDISLMIVWLSMRLPYDVEGAEEEDTSSEEGSGEE